MHFSLFFSLQNSVFAAPLFIHFFEFYCDILLTRGVSECNMNWNVVKFCCLLWVLMRKSIQITINILWIPIPQFCSYICAHRNEYIGEIETDWGWAQRKQRQNKIKSVERWRSEVYCVVHQRGKLLRKSIECSLCGCRWFTENKYDKNESRKVGVRCGVFAVEHANWLWCDVR